MLRIARQSIMVPHLFVVTIISMMLCGMYVFVYGCTQAYIYIYTHLCMQVYLYICADMYLHLCMCTRTDMYTYGYVCFCEVVSTCVCSTVNTHMSVRMCVLYERNMGVYVQVHECMCMKESVYTFA